MKQVLGLIWLLAFMPATAVMAQDEGSGGYDDSVEYMDSDDADDDEGEDEDEDDADDSGSATDAVLEAVAEDASGGAVSEEDEYAEDDAEDSDEGDGYDEYADDDEGDDEDYAEESVGTVEVASEDEDDEEEEVTPWNLFVGADQVITTLSLSGLDPTAENEFDSGLYRLRGGWQFGENASLELQVGVEQSADAPDEVATAQYYGAFVAASTDFEYVKLAFPVGYAYNSIEAASGGDSESYGGLAFGIDAELPLQRFIDGLPDFRVTVGWMTYYQGSDARLYGLNAGLRYDFSIGGGGESDSGF